ncbi:hypothetical protein AUEXF2481DRAFT_35552 [Aureobasidium subglaciale EXF-2481]|uniref:Uncharacterized protein n=1 Tax=Aureobasidium subglaciale (strain EXF-2481) TaxID=1043005 RepID=A0A074ZMR2_AURSE|nr:uncharacterized protein AUEXF2481DRAFT_35552 [Aureobasidium subglaciale EXF-2481]KEQ99636.1 hypothetical protein AUEXF2481DRAFT_35552 [Aureobasidium subglaciale EXF-2481]
MVAPLGLLFLDLCICVVGGVLCLVSLIVREGMGDTGRPANGCLSFSNYDGWGPISSFLM